MNAPLQPDEVARIIVLARGRMEQGGNYWCYLSVKPSRYKTFQQAIAQYYNIQHFDQDGFGEVIVSGEGEVPPEAVTQQVATIFSVPVAELFSLTDPERALEVRLSALQAQASE